MQRILLVQCCHPPQFSYIARAIRRRHPECVLEGLVLDEPRNLSRLTDTDDLSALHRWSKGRPLPGGFDKVVFPMVCRGCRSMKRLARRLADPQTCGYDGELSPLQRGWMGRSLLRVEPWPQDFPAYHRDYPMPLLGKRILLVESSCGLHKATENRWRRFLSPDAEITRVQSGGLISNWFRHRGRTFDAVVCFWTAEARFQWLRWLPLCLGLMPTIVVEESGQRRVEKASEWLRLVLHLIRHGQSSPNWVPRILLVQTESVDYVEAAVERLRRAPSHPQHEMTVLCRHQDRQELERRLPDCDFVSQQGRGLVAAWKLIRQARRCQPDCLAAIFTGRLVFPRYKALYFLLNVRRRLAFNAALGFYPLTWRTFPRIFRKEELLFDQSPKGRFLLLESEGRAQMLGVLEKLKSPKLAGQAPILMACHSSQAEFYRSHPLVDEVLAYDEQGWWKLRKELKRSKPDVAVAILGGYPGWRRSKMLFFLLPSRHRLVFNSYLECFYLSPRTWTQVLKPPAGPSRRFLLVQTDDDRRMANALKKLLDPKLAGGQSVAVLCNENKRDFFASFPQVGEIHTYRKGQWKYNLNTYLRLRRPRPDVVVSVLGGRPTFRGPKFLFFALPARHRLVFNSHLECYYLTSGTRRLLFRRLPEPIDNVIDESVRHRMFFVQTEDEETTLEAIEALWGPRIAPIAHLAVYCREDKEQIFAAHPRVSQVITYPRGKPLSHLKTLWNLRSLGFDSTAAVFSGRPIFRLQKLLFLLTPVRFGLVFNQNLDCFYFSWKRPQDLLTLRRGVRTATGNPLLRQGLKVLLWLPRFLYLVMWLTGIKLRRAYRLSGKEASERGLG